MIDRDELPASGVPAAASAAENENDRALREAADVLAGVLADFESPPEPPDAFRRLLRPEFLRSFVERDLRRLLAGLPPATKNAPAGHLRLYVSPRLVIRARIVAAGDPVSASVATLTRHTLLGNAGRSPVIVRRWQLPPGYANDVFDPTVLVTPQSDVLLEPGDAVALSAGFDAYEVRPGDRAAVVVTAAGPPIVPLSWLYELATRRPVRADPARTEWLFLRELLKFAEMIGDASLAPVLVNLAEHPSHFVRWAAGKTAHSIAPDAGRAALQALAADAHPQVRAAARSLLAESEPE